MTQLPRQEIQHQLSITSIMSTYCNSKEELLLSKQQPFT